MVTASHSPAHHGGLKIMRDGAAPVSGEEVWRWIEEDGLGLYADFLRGEVVKGGRIIKVVFDCSNGSTGRVLKKVFLKNYAVEAVFINDKEDANFTAHGPDPLGEGAMDELKQVVIDCGADLGVIFDADGDRAFFINESGEEISSAQALTLMGMSLPAKERVVIDQIIGALPSRVLGDWEIEVLESRVGNIFVREKMREVDATLGGEYSGHFYFRNFGFNDSGIFAAIQLINLLKVRSESISDLLNSWPKFYAKMVNFEFEKDLVPQMIERIITECGFTAREINRDDGVKLIFDDYFIAVRASNTEDLLRLNVEAISEEVLEEVLERVSGLIEAD
jgi:phosphomannomutase